MEPQARLGVASLTKMAFDGVDLTPIRTQIISQCLHSDMTDGLIMDLSVIEQLSGNQEAGLELQENALQRHRIFSTIRPDTARRKLLVFAEPRSMGGNTPVEFLLQDSQFEIITCYPDFTQGRQQDLPPYDVAFCAAAADSDTAPGFFASLRSLTSGTGIATLNLPDNLVNPDRDSLCEIFRHVPGMRIPETRRMSRETLLLADVDFPIIIRPTGSHAGAGLEKLSDPEDLERYLSENKAENYFLSEFINYACAHDDQFRKYRIVFVDGQPFPCHMAISDQWDIWYLNARMDEFPERRAEEEAFMDNFKTFAQRHQKPFEALCAGIGLDYFGIDCAEDSEGNLVVFEADNALIVHDMDPESIFPYKSRHMKNIFSAFENMLLRHCHDTEKQKRQ